MPTLRPNPTKTAKAFTNANTGESENRSCHRDPAKAQEYSQSYPKTAPPIEKYEKKSLQHYANGFNSVLPNPAEFPHLAYLFQEPKSEPFSTFWGQNINRLPTKKDREYKIPGRDEVPEYIKKWKPVVPITKEGQNWYWHLNGPTPKQAARVDFMKKNLVERNKKATRYDSYISYARNEATVSGSAFQPLPRDKWSTLRVACDVFFRTVHRKNEEKQQNIDPCDCRNGQLHLHQERIPQPEEKLSPLEDNPTAEQANDYLEKKSKAIEIAAREAVQRRREDAELNRVLPPTCGHLKNFRDNTNFRGVRRPPRYFYASAMKRDRSRHWKFDPSELDVDSFAMTPQPISPAEGSLPTKENAPTKKSQVPQQAQAPKPRTPLPSGRIYDVGDYLRRQAAKKALEGSKKTPTPEPTYVIVDGEKKLSVRVTSPKRKTDAQEESSHVSKKQKTSNPEDDINIPVAKAPASMKRKSADQLSAKVAKKQKTLAASSSSTPQQTFPTANDGNMAMEMAQTPPVNISGQQQEERVDPKAVWASDDHLAKLRLLGLTQNVYRKDDTTEASGMCDQPSCRGPQLRPFWSWVTWILLARCREFQCTLSLKTIHELGMAWFPALQSTKQQSLRAGLSRGTCFVPIGEATWRLRRADEALPAKGAGPGTGTGKTKVKKQGGSQAEEMPRFDEHNEQVESDDIVEGDEIDEDIQEGEEGEDGGEGEESSTMIHQ
ncbi:hypothetical protein DL98DRAFT_640682 [Cadophora sp. DSE1049]|nr:hypothetical protein DL98DRAFT_640682 [Cadophora sp. DSE1049]